MNTMHKGGGFGDSESRVLTRGSHFAGPSPLELHASLRNTGLCYRAHCSVLAIKFNASLLVFSLLFTLVVVGNVTQYVNCFASGLDISIFL